MCWWLNHDLDPRETEEEEEAFLAAGTLTRTHPLSAASSPLKRISSASDSSSHLSRRGTQADLVAASSCRCCCVWCRRRRKRPSTYVCMWNGLAGYLVASGGTSVRVSHLTTYEEGAYVIVITLSPHLRFQGLRAAHQPAHAVQELGEEGGGPLDVFATHPGFRAQGLG